MRRVEEAEKISDVRCLFIDLDGTLMDSKKQISEISYEALMRMQQKGVHLVIATGRPRTTIPVLPKDLHVDYYITSNGSVIYDHDFHVVYEKCLKPSSMEHVFRCCTKDYMMQMFVHGVIHVDQYAVDHMDHYDIPESNRNNVLTKGVFHEDFAADYREHQYPCEKINILFRRPFDVKTMLKLRERIREDRDVATVSGGVENLEVTDIHVNKAEAVAFVTKRLGIDISQTAGFGDSDNDSELFDAVHYGIAMENACEALKMKAYAVTKSNDEDGVAYALKMLWS